MEENKTILLIRREYPKEVIPLIEKAKNSIKIIVYEWRWYENQLGSSIQLFNNAIIRAKKRGVEVKAVLKNQKISKKLKDQKIWVKEVDFSKTLHVKLIMIDNEIVILGSHNFTLNAFHINDEVSVIIKSPEIVEKLLKHFGDYFT